MKEFQYILWDMDGTLIDSSSGVFQSLRKTLEHYHRPPVSEQVMRNFIGPPTVDSFRDTYGFAGEELNAVVDTFHEFYVADGVFDNQLYAGLPDLFQRLIDQGKHLYVATSKPEELAEQILARHGVDHYFTDVCGSLLDNTRLTKDDVLGYLLNKHGLCGREDVVMIGDRKFDLLGAKRFSLASIGVLYGFGSREELEACGADYIVSDVDALSSLLLHRERIRV